MGTRSLTIVVDGRNGEEICVLYRQMDGYPTGHGQELRNFLEPLHIVNGISVSENRPIANGAGCLAAQLVAHFKNEPGSFYLYPTGTRDCGESYRYTVTAAEDMPIRVRVERAYNAKVLFDGRVLDFNPDAVEAAESEE